MLSSFIEATRLSAVSVEVIAFCCRGCVASTQGLVSPLVTFRLIRASLWHGCTTAPLAALALNRRGFKLPVQIRVTSGAIGRCRLFDCPT